MSYVLANGQPGDRAIYYTGQEDSHGGELWGNINDAFRFETLEGVFERIKYEGCTASPIIVEIMDCTWEVIEQGYKDFEDRAASTARKVYHEYNTVSYITNSRER